MHCYPPRASIAAAALPSGVRGCPTAGQVAVAAEQDAARAFNPADDRGIRLPRLDDGSVIAGGAQVAAEACQHPVAAEAGVFRWPRHRLSLAARPGAVARRSGGERDGPMHRPREQRLDLTGRASWLGD